MERTFEWASPPAPKRAGVSNDDPLWFVSCNLAMVRSLIEDPTRWMAELSAAATAKEGTPVTLTLAQHFAMKIRLLPGAGQIAKPDLYMVQGIDKTGIVTIRPGIHSIAPLVDPWNDYWKEWADSGTVMTAGIDNGVGYAHLEITKAGDKPDVRADKIAAFLIRSATGARDGNGDIYLNKILRKKAVLPPLASGVLKAPAQADGSCAELPDPDAVAGINFSYAGEQGATTPACDNMAGNVNAGGQIVVDDVTVKLYP